MSDRKKLDYGRMMQKALRGLMAEVLGRVAEDGLPDKHHFYIGIDTTHPGVDMAPWLRDRYPEEMVIVLQDWFADLAVLGDRFQVTLNFSNSPQTLVVPFDAVQTFIDPSVKFGLKFDDSDGAGFDASADDDDTPHRPMITDRRDVAADLPEDDDDGPGGGDKGGARTPGGSAEVVRLDRFRKI